MCTRPLLPHSWGRGPIGSIMAGLGLGAKVHLCHKRGWGQAKLLCRAVYRKRMHGDLSLDGDPCPAIRKDRLCKGHHRMTGGRRIKIGTRIRELGQTWLPSGPITTTRASSKRSTSSCRSARDWPQHVKLEHCAMCCRRQISGFKDSAGRKQTHKITFKIRCRVSMPIHHVAR